MQIFLISGDENIKKIILGDLKNAYPAARIKSQRLDEEVSADVEKYLMAIMDISTLPTGRDPVFVRLCQNIIKSNLPVLIIADILQKDLVRELSGMFPKAGDFLLKDNIRQEFLLRIDLIIGKLNYLIPQNSIKVDELVLDLDSYELKIGGKKIGLTFKEYELLKLLLENRNKVLSRNKLLSMIWEYDFYGGSRTVDVHMRRLRFKLEPPYSDMLKTVRNVGYMFSP